jgi:hypothetical protein
MKETQMKSRKWTLLIASFVILTLAAIPVAAQKKPGETVSLDKKVTVKGKILYMKSLGGYYLMGEDPPGEMIIENPNPGLLKTLHEKGKTVTVEGYNTIGADHFFIEKLDGKPYRGER